MAVKRSQNWLNQQRVDVPHLRSIESAVRNDFDELFAAFVLGESNSYVIRGFDIEMAGSIGASANGLQLIVEDSAILHGASNESGTFFELPPGTPNQVLSATTNVRVEGAFTPGALNYVSLEFVREVDDSTTDQLYLWNPTTQSEITKTLPLAETLDYKIVISSSLYTSNVLPIAIVETDASNNVLNIQDRRPMLFRLATAGSATPDPFYEYPWENHVEGRAENFWQSSSSTVSPFRGGDKQIRTFKENDEAIKTELKQIKGTTYWYSPNSAGSIAGLRYDLGNTLFTGRGYIEHSNAVPGRLNWNEDMFLTVVSTRLKYKLEANLATADISLANNQVAYVQLVRGIDVIPQLVFTNGADEVTSVGAITWTTDLEAGDYVKVASSGDTEYYKILSVDSPSQVTLTENFGGTSTGINGTDAKIAFGNYRTNVAPSTERHIKVANIEDVPFDADTYWLFLRADNDGQARIYVRFLNAELEVGEQLQISDQVPAALLSYIGSANDSDSDPDFTNATGSAITNIHLTDGENLTLSAKRLEHRDDVIPRVRVIDIVSTSLPTGASVTIDGQVLNNDDYVFFRNPAIEGLYKVSGTGSSVAFEPIAAFKGITTPVDGDLIRVEAGTDYFKTIWKRTGNDWRPLEVKEATKEPTGFPNRVDSEILFDNPTRTFSVQPKAPQTFFDTFVKGKPYRYETAQEIVIPDVEGIYFFYFEVDGTLTFDTVFDLTIITEKVFISTVYWDAVNKEAILIGDERHGITMDSATHEYLHNLNGAVLTRGGDIGFVPFEAPAAAQFSGLVSGLSSSVTVDADNTGLAGNVTLNAVGAAAQFDGQVSGMTTDVTIDADNVGLAGNITLTANPALNATAVLTLTANITLSSVAIGSARNTDSFQLEVNPAAANPTDTILVDFTGTADAIICTVTPNDGTNNGATPVDLTTAELAELINTGAVTGKNVTITDVSSFRTLQTATGGDATVLADGGEGDSAGDNFAGGFDGEDIDTLIAAWNLANPANTVTLSVGDGTQVPQVDITLTGGIDAENLNTLISNFNIANPSNTLTLSVGDGTQIPTADITLTGGLDGSGDTDDDAQISLNNMTLRDEDIVMDITTVLLLQISLSKY
jgi:hypothetical protein